MSNSECLPLPLYLTALVSRDAKYYTDIVDNSTQVYCKTMHGLCEIEFENGDSFKGDLSEGYATGAGVYRYRDGTVQSGEFLMNRAHGQGSLSVVSSQSSVCNSLYTGQFDHGQRHGKGKYDIPGLGFSYTGDFNRGKVEGQATVTYKNGSEYTGEILEGQRHGRGKIVYKSGNFYEGDWVEGKKQGKGTMSWLDRLEEVDSSHQV